MTLTMILALIGLFGTAAAIRWARALLRPAHTLGLTLFRPYRGDTWPQGVQEDYEVRFDWSPRKPPPVHAPVTLAVRAVDDIEFEDLDGEATAIEHVQGSIHTTRH